MHPRVPKEQAELIAIPLSPSLNGHHNWERLLTPGKKASS